MHSQLFYIYPADQNDIVYQKLQSNELAFDLQKEHNEGVQKSDERPAKGKKISINEKEERETPKR